MRFGAVMIARAVLIVCAIGVLWTAIAFLGFAIYAGFQPALGFAGAAALTGGILLLVLASGVLAFFSLAPAATPVALATVTARAPEQAGLTAALSQLANEHPFLAVGCAALLGIANTLEADGKRSRRG